MARGPSLASCLALAVLLAVPGAASPATPAPVQGEGAVTVGERYDRCAVHRAWFGAGYRDLWSTPIAVPMLDLEASGGLHPVMEVGSMQTLGLAFEDARGGSYTFRSLDKDPSRLLPRLLRIPPWTLLYRDQISASLPGAPLVAGFLERELGILSTPVRLVQLPDDPALGAFRERFAGRVGTFHVYPTADDEAPGTFEALEIVSTAELFDRAMRDGERPDARAYLWVRLLDLWIGDWDRHPEQMRWARRGGPGAPWLPVPEDRDGAFARYGGWFLDTFRPLMERLVRFEADYPDDAGLFLQARNLDAWVLAGLEREVWRETLAAFVAALDGDLIERAVAELPAPWHARRGAWLAEALHARREGLPEQAGRLYARLAREVRWLGTPGPDRLEGRCLDDGSLELTLSGANGAATRSRRFVPDETERAVVWLHGGPDLQVLEGAERCGVAVEVHADEPPSHHRFDRGVPRWD